MNKYSVILITVLFLSAVCAESQTCTSVTTTTCDPEENPPFSSSASGRHHGNAIKRGKAGPKGEKGERGPAGPAGTDLSEVVAEVSAASARHSRQLNRNSALLSELNGEISNVESEQNRCLVALTSQQNGTMEKLVALVGRQSEEIMRLNKHVDDLSSCTMPEIALTTTNSTKIVPHNTVVKYQCKYFEAEGETVRSCIKGNTIPSFQTNPLKCAKEKLSFKEAQEHCKEHNMILLQTGIETTAKRQELCRKNGADHWVWIGLEKESSGGLKWRLADGSDVPASFDYEWLYGRSAILNAGYDFMRVWCRSGSLFGQLENVPHNYSNYDFFCQDQ